MESVLSTSATRAMALLVVAIAMTSAVMGMPPGTLKKHHCAHHARKSQTVQDDPNALQSGYYFGGGYDFGQQFAPQFGQQFAPQFVQQFGQQFDQQQFGQQQFVQQIGQQVGQAYLPAEPVPGTFRSALTNDQRRIVPQTSGTAQDNKAPPSSNKLETTTENRTFIGAPQKDCKAGQVKNQDRECVDAKSAPDDSK